LGISQATDRPWKFNPEKDQVAPDPARHFTPEQQTIVLNFLMELNFCFGAKAHRDPQPTNTGKPPAGRTGANQLLANLRPSGRDRVQGSHICNDSSSNRSQQRPQRASTMLVAIGRKESFLNQPPDDSCRENTARKWDRKHGKDGPNIEICLKLQIA
jgi:hypothetical protein